MKAELAPIILFAYDRPDHLKMALNALSQNAEFNLSKLFIYCDGPKSIANALNVDTTKIVANQWRHPNKTVIESDINLGLGASVIRGVTQIIETYGKAIVVEDDLEVSRFFLNYLNQALRKYENNSKIMHISAYMFPINEFHDRAKTLFLPNISSWGWATWKRAWSQFERNAIEWELLLDDKSMRRAFDVDGSYAYSDMLFRQMTGEIDSWAIRWNWSVFRASGLVVYPPVSFVKNIGFDGSGTHCSISNFEDNQLMSMAKPPIFLEDIEVSKEEMSYIKAALKKLSGPTYIRVIKLIGKNFRIFRLKLKIR